MTDDEMAQSVQEGLAANRRWVYIEQTGDPNVVRKVVVTEREILRDYYPYWQDQMIRQFREDEIDPEKCIQDWITVHWAWGLDD